MRILTATSCLAITLLLGSVGASWSADFQKGLTAYQSGDYATALREWTPLAEQGDAGAQYNLGMMYDNGQGVPQDSKTSVKWDKLSAEQGDALAQTNLEVLSGQCPDSRSNPSSGLGLCPSSGSRVRDLVRM